MRSRYRSRNETGARAAGRIRPLSTQAFAACLDDPRFLDYVPQFIVPSPLIGRYGLTQDGHKSARALSNVGSRWYLVTEFDDGRKQGQQAAKILWLTGVARSSNIKLAMVLFSGKKSLHAWWDVRRLDETVIMEFFQIVCSIGCDPCTKTRSQLVRTPKAANSFGGNKAKCYPRVTNLC